MLRDVFYYNTKPNVHPRERFAENLTQARSLSTTEHFWIINEFCDYRNFDWDFDFEFLPDEDVWAESHNNVWPSQHQKDSGTWLCPKEFSEYIIYRGDVDPVIRKNEKNDNWVELDLIDHTKFDFSWHPDPTNPPYIYKWPCKFFPAEFKHVLEYRVPGATQEKYMNIIAELVPEHDRWVEHQLIDKDRFDLSWRPNPLDPPFIYIWGNKHIDGKLKPTLEYHVPGATDKKYMPSPVEVLPEWDKWVEVQEVDKKNFDFTWRPDPKEPPYIYTWGNKWIDAEIYPTLEYHCEGATDRKYMSNDVSVMPETAKWKILQNILLDSFDFTWRPDPREPPYTYVFGNELYDAIKMPTVIYSMPEEPEIKYIHDITAKLAGDKNLYEHLEDAELEDYAWLPDPDSPPYIYVWGNQWNKPEDKISIQLTVPGATEYKYMEQRAVRKPNRDCWEIPDNLVLDTFDFSWEPNPKEPPYVYQFGTQWQKTGGPKYVLADATEIKYIDVIKATRSPNTTNFYTVTDRNTKDFDYSWHPDETEEPYIYVFGNNWYSAEKEPTIEYRTPGATERKYINDTVAWLSNDMTNWEIPSNVDKTKFDFSWYPDPGSPPYIYEFATMWNDRGGPVYTVPGATDYKYLENIKATLISNRDNWEIIDGVNADIFDLSWVPHPEAPPYIYQFGTLVDDIWIENGPRYVTPGNNGVIVKLENSTILTDEIIYPRYYIDTTLENLVKEHSTEMFWVLNNHINYDSFDFSWKPTKENLFNVTVFGSPESETTQTYFVNAPTYLEGHTGLNFIQHDQEIDEQYLAELFVKPDIFYVDRGNSEAQERFDALKELFGNRIQKTRYLNSWVDTINRCINRSTTELLWVLNSGLDYSNFNFNYYPNPWQIKMVHVFGTQWSHWGTTFLVNAETFGEDTKYIKIIEHLSNLNFVKDIKATATICPYDILLIDHKNIETLKVAEQLQYKISNRTITTVDYVDSYLNTIRNYVTKLPDRKEHYLWVCSSVCDYSKFDFTYVCDPFAIDNLHVFPSGTQKFGDTFFIDVNKTKEIIGQIEKLEEYHKINFNNAVKSSRLPEPVIVTNDDTHVDAVTKVIGFPYATIITDDNVDIDTPVVEPMNLWASETKNILITSTGATRIVVPIEAREHVTKELYDYPHIKRMPNLVRSKPIDIVFLSNGETDADENYEHLLHVTKELPNRVVRVDGVNGRVAAYHAAAEASNTPWMFTVFAKLKISAKFDWSWQPDRMQVPKHYIFHAKNPVNGLIYGHQAMIAYNKKLTLANDGKGLDFTLDDEHEVVPLISGTAHYNSDPFSTWRTAFREVLKLKADDSDESKYRLDAWLNKAEGEYSEYSIKGALDAVEYYNEVDGDFDKLKLSYEWSWLREKFEQN